MNKDLGFAAEQLKQLSEFRQAQKQELLKTWNMLFETFGQAMQSCTAIREINIRFNENKYHEIVSFDLNFVDATGRRIFEPNLHGMGFEDYAVIININKALQYNLTDFIQDFPNLRHGDKIKISSRGCVVDLAKYEQIETTPSNIA